MTTGRMFTSRAPMTMPRRTSAIGFALRLSNTSGRGGAITTSSCCGTYRWCSLGQSLSDGAFLDGGSRSLCFRNGRFSITTLFVTLAFICYNETVQITIFVRVRLVIEVLIGLILGGHVRV